MRSSGARPRKLEDREAGVAEFCKGKIEVDMLGIVSVGSRRYQAKGQIVEGVRGAKSVATNCRKHEWILRRKR